MTLKHEELELAAIESVSTRLDELRVVLGPEVGQILDVVKASLIEAMACRDRGDVEAAISAIGSAMDRLTHLADRMDAAEGAMMRAVAQAFRTALLRGSFADAKQAADVMMRRSGAIERKTK
jgi:hypothetical protein